MNRNNTIGIVGTLTTSPKLIYDAPDWLEKVYEATLKRVRPSGVADTYILQFDGKAAGSKETVEKIAEGVEVLIGGEVRTENIHNPRPEENRVKIFIYAEIIAVNDPPAGDQNEVKICGHICTPPKSKQIHRETRDNAEITSVIVAVNTLESTSFIPCIFWNNEAKKAAGLKVGDYVEIFGRFQSHRYKKQIWKTAYEINVMKSKVFTAKRKEKKESDNTKIRYSNTEKKRDASHDNHTEGRS